MQASVKSSYRRVRPGIFVSAFVGLAFIVWMSGSAFVRDSEVVATNFKQLIPLSAPSRWATFKPIWHTLTRRVSGASTASVAAVPASKFARAIGVNVHMGYYWTLYNNVTLVKKAISYLGIDHVRDKLLDWPNVQKNYQELAADGAKFDFLLPAYSGHPNTVKLSEFVSMVGALAQAHPGAVAAVEGPNEVNIWPAWYHGGANLPDQAALQRDLYAAIRRNGDLNGIPVYNLTLAYTDAGQFAQLGNLSRVADYANSHAYLKSDETPQYSLGRILPYAKRDAPGLPIVITETGYETNTANSYSGVDPTVQAKLTLDELMDTFAAGVSRTYLYELFDEGGEDFGLFNADGTPKPAARAIHDLMMILRDSGAPDRSSSPGRLSYAILDGPANANRLLIGKSDGMFDLVLWTESTIWSSAGKKEIAAPVETSGLEFGHRQKTISVFDPLQGTAPIASYHDVQSIRVALSDHPIIVEIRPLGGSRHASD